MSIDYKTHTRTVINNQGSATQVEYDDDQYAELLNDIYGQVEVCGYKYWSGDLLKDVDPVTFRIGKVDYNSSAGWTCDHCGQRHDTKERAVDCCHDEDEFEIYECEHCGSSWDEDEEYDAEEKAFGCCSYLDVHPS